MRTVTPTRLAVILALALAPSCGGASKPSNPPIGNTGTTDPAGGGVPDTTPRVGSDGDGDGDGLGDNLDQCPGDPEDFDSFEDEDGCPDPDNDKDSVPDSADACPDVPGTSGSADGCPGGGGGGGGGGRDGDGVSDSVDKCPDDPEDYDGFQDQDGCPEIDNDRDGVMDVDDLCPNQAETKNGFEDDDGCPDKHP
jgi:hypothetical protein